DVAPRRESRQGSWPVPPMDRDEPEQADDVPPDGPPPTGLPPAPDAEPATPDELPTQVAGSGVVSAQALAEVPEGPSRSSNACTRCRSARSSSTCTSNSSRVPMSRRGQ